MVQDCVPALPLKRALFAISPRCDENLFDVSRTKHVEGFSAASHRILAGEENQLAPGIIRLQSFDNRLQMRRSSSLRELPRRVAESSPPERDPNESASISPLFYGLLADRQNLADFFGT